MKGDAAWSKVLFGRTRPYLVPFLITDLMSTSNDISVLASIPRERKRTVDRNSKIQRMKNIVVSINSDNIVVSVNVVSNKYLDDNGTESEANGIAHLERHGAEDGFYWKKTSFDCC